GQNGHHHRNADQRGTQDGPPGDRPLVSKIPVHHGLITSSHHLVGRGPCRPPRPSLRRSTGKGFNRAQSGGSPPALRAGHRRTSDVHYMRRSEPPRGCPHGRHTVDSARDGSRQADAPSSSTANTLSATWSISAS